MPNQIYDAVVVGARCAGAPTAMLLARKGYRVLLADRTTFPSDTVSTHLVHPPGLAALDRWGLLPQVIASGCPPIATYSFDFGPFTIEGSPMRLWVPGRVRAAPYGPGQDPRRCRGPFGRGGAGALHRRGPRGRG